MPTVVSLKQLFLNQVAPGNEVEFLRLLTEADMKLLQWGRWSWCKARATLTIVNGVVTLPSAYASILGAQVNGHAKDIRAEEFEFTPDGIGDIDVGGCGPVRLIDQGIDDNGLRHYKVTGHLDEDVEISALLHRAPAILFDPEQNNPDLPTDAVSTTRCPDASALKLTMMSLVMEETSDLELSSQYMATALRALDNKEQATRGGARQQLNIRQNGPGVRRIRSFR